MNSQPEDSLVDGEVSLGWLIKSLAHGFVETLRRNKVATFLATSTLVVLIALTLDSRYDGLSRYQEGILPRLSRLETVFLATLRTAESTSGEWRAYYFENAHRQVKDILRAARLHRPGADVARRKHREFVRYYELLDLEFRTIEMQLSMDPDTDYLHRLNGRIQELKPVRDVWAQWVEQNKIAAEPVTKALVSEETHGEQ